MLSVAHQARWTNQVLSKSFPKRATKLGLSEERHISSLFKGLTTFMPKMSELELEETKSEPSKKADDPDYDENDLSKLRESYSKAKKNGSNLWVNYKKSCYVYLFKGGGEPCKILASFDLDGTVIKPKSNRRVPRSATDWQLFSVWTKVKIQQTLKENNSRLVIFTNQNGVGLGIVPLEEVQQRIELVCQRLNIPSVVFVAIDKDKFRKPQTGMFELFSKSFNESVPVDREHSFYCGDAVGYPSHSDADIMFARTLRLPFLPPEKFLRGVKPKLLEPI